MVSRLWQWARIRSTFWLLLGTFALGLLLLVGAVILPPHLLDTSGLTTEARLKAENDLRSTLVTLLGGIVVSLGAVVGILNFRETSRQNRAEADRNRAVLELERRGQMAERFTKAIEQLGQVGVDNLDVRIGAAYALEQIALDSDELHWPVIEVLTAYLREHTRKQKRRELELEHGEPDTQAGQWHQSLEPDFQAVATVVGRRRLEKDPPGRSLNLLGVRLQWADLRSAQLAGADLRGSHLEEANLSGAQLGGANLIGAQLKLANLTAADLRGAQFREVAQLLRADHRKEYDELAVRYVAQLNGAILINANLDGADLHRGNLEGADLTGAQLERADLSSAHLQRAIVYVANLEDADLDMADLTDTIGLSWDQLKSARATEGAKLPGYLEAERATQRAADPSSTVDPSTNAR